VISERALFSYKCTDFYAAGSEIGVAWDDPEIGIEWPIQSPQLSGKDQQNRRLRDIPVDTLPRYE
jgi:dTDP-4-dehydrorhamnose 3,5-epimerase